MAVKLPKLPYAMNALEPYISEQAVEFHYGKHHKHYVDALNNLIEGTAMDKLSLEEIMFKTYKKNVELYNNAGQAWNHKFFWKCLAPHPALPTEKFLATLNKNFESHNKFKDAFDKAANELFGSGWVWLVKDQQGKLQIRALSNADNPLMTGEIPLLTCDLWEHAYYLDYQNERGKFLEGFWKLVNWAFVEYRYEEKFDKPKHIPTKLKKDSSLEKSPFAI